MWAQCGQLGLCFESHKVKTKCWLLELLPEGLGKDLLASAGRVVVESSSWAL